MCKRKLFVDFVELEEESSAPSSHTVATLGRERTFYFSTSTALSGIAKKCLDLRQIVGSVSTDKRMHGPAELSISVAKSVVSDCVLLDGS